jgi:hypothetical protein
VIESNIYHHIKSTAKSAPEPEIPARIMCSGGPLDGQLVDKNASDSGTLFCMSEGLVGAYRLVRVQESLAHTIHRYVYRESRE